MELTFKQYEKDPWSASSQAPASIADITDIDELLGKLGLDWRVEAKPVFVGKKQAKKLAIVRTDVGVPHGILGWVSERYKPADNRTLFGVVERFLRPPYSLTPFAGGSLKGGKTVWLQLVAENWTDVVREGDIYKPHLLITTQHDGRGAVRLTWTSMRIVCSNMLSTAIAPGETISIKHIGYKSSKEIADAAANAISAGIRIKARSHARYRQMCEYSMDDFTAKKYIQSVVPEKIGGKRDTARRRRQDEMLWLFTNGQGNRGLSLWDAYNAVTEWETHCRLAKSNPDKRLFNTILGSGKQIRDRAWEEAMRILGEET